MAAASSDVADKLQIHEMAVVNGVMQMRQLADGLRFRPQDRSSSTGRLSHHADRAEKAAQGRRNISADAYIRKAGDISVTVKVQPWMPEKTIRAAV